jgi:hypothetical protein
MGCIRESRRPQSAAGRRRWRHYGRHGGRRNFVVGMISGVAGALSTGEGLVSIKPHMLTNGATITAQIGRHVVSRGG